MSWYREQLDGPGRLLTLACRSFRTATENEEMARQLHALGIEVCRDIARRNQVEWVVAETLCRELGTQILDPAWRDDLESNRRRVEHLLEALLEVGTSLEREGIAWALIENAGVLFSSKLALEAFCAGDFDMLVARERWSEALKVFASHGFHAEDRRGRPTNRAELCRIEHDGRRSWLNAGHVAFDRMWVPLAHHDRCEQWLARRTRSSRHSDIWVLAPEDGLALVAMHTSLHSFVRAPFIRLHMDVDRIVCDNAIDWPTLVREIALMGVPTRAFVSLAMARDLLGTPVPADVLEELEPGILRSSALSALLSRNGVFARQRRKLPPLQTVMLDALVTEQNMTGWLTSVLWPPSDWISEHFPTDDIEARRAAPWQLQWRRYRAALSRWKPV